MKKSSVLFLTFNRFENTKKVFKSIKYYQPNKLYIASDGAREKVFEESKKVLNIRNYLLSNIDWPCEIKTLFREKNLGCKYAVSGALNWFFKNEEQGIILEDDCLPNKSFFKFCDELLEKYKKNDRIAMISGNHLNTHKIGNADYYFKKIPHIWGWASWRRAWLKYDIDMIEYPSFKKNSSINKIFKNQKIQKYWINIFDQVYKGKINTWDYQLAYTVFKNNQLCINPNKNLVSNIGFDDLSTHTSIYHKEISNLKLENLNFPLKHPRKILYHEYNDGYANTFNLKYYKFKNILKIIGLFKVIKTVYKIIK